MEISVFATFSCHFLAIWQKKTTFAAHLVLHRKRLRIGAKMGMQWKSATLPDAVSPFFRTVTSNGHWTGKDRRRKFSPSFPIVWEGRDSHKDKVRRPANAIQVTRACGITGIDGNLFIFLFHGKVRNNLSEAFCVYVPAEIRDWHYCAHHCWQQKKDANSGSLAYAVNDTITTANAGTNSSLAEQMEIVSSAIGFRDSHTSASLLQCKKRKTIIQTDNKNTKYNSDWWLEKY